MKQIYFFIVTFLCCGTGLFAQRLINSSCSEHITTVYDYQYAPGQHALNYASFENRDELKEKFKGNSSNGYILLGGWGGYIIGGFDHSIMNRSNYDFGVYSQPGYGDEPGVVYVMKDENGNGQPDDTWYELAGNVVGSEGYIRDYQVTYFKPETTANPDTKVHWEDNKGNTGVLNMAKWWDATKEQVTFFGVKLPNNKENTSGPYWYDIKGLYTSGYAEVYSANDYDKAKKYNQFDISNAVDANGNKVVLDYIDFIKVQTGCFLEAGWLGEVSTEVSGAVDLNIVDFAATFDEHVLAEESEQYADASATAQYESVTQNLNSGSFAFKNIATQWGSPESPSTSWYGVAFSNRTDNTSLGDVSNQFNSAAGGDISGSGTYGVVYDARSGGMSTLDPITFDITGHPQGKQITGCYITNNTYATNSMRNGDGFAKAFGGNNGNDKDWFKLTATGIDVNGNETSSVDFYLADYRFDDNTQDYIVEDWKWLDLSSLGTIASVKFSTSSSDAGEWGMNTPAYFCIDNIDKPVLQLVGSIDDVTVEKGANDLFIDLTGLFVDPINRDITKAISGFYNQNIASASVEGNQLKLSFAGGEIGETNITLKATCGDMTVNSTFKVTVATSTDLNNPKEDQAISVYPNPFTETFTIKGYGSYGGQYQLYSLTGQQVLNGHLNSGEQKVVASQLPAGSYILVIETEQGRITQKIIKR